MNLYCEHPVVIVNPKIRHILIECKGYYTPSGYVELGMHSVSMLKLYTDIEVKRMFSPRKFIRIDYVTQSELDQLLSEYVCISPRTGEIYPMFIEVPCGKCALCKEKKSREWSFRALCENNTSISEPYFVTLTYNPRCVPKQGLSKKDVQLFLKRLRIRLDRLNIKHNIRYFAVGEYGKKCKRPHYHLILWNFPNDYYHFPHLYKILHFIEDSWTFHVHKNGVPQYCDDGSPLLGSKGFCYCVPCRRGAISYVMKYMRKGFEAPKGKTPIFFLSSRGNGGIGSKYIMDLQKYYHEHPDLCEMSVVDKYTGVQQSTYITGYVKYKLFPSISRVIPKEIRDTHHELLNLISERYYLRACMGYEKSVYLSHDEKEVLKRYSFLKNYYTYDYAEHLDLFFTRLPDWARQSRYRDIGNRIQGCIDVLNHFHFDSSYCRNCSDYMGSLSCALASRLYDKPDIDIQSVKDNLQARFERMLLKEVIY